MNEQVPLSFPGRREPAGNATIILAGDIGGTKTNLGLFRAENSEVTLIKETGYPSRDYDNLAGLIRQFLSENGNASPGRICLGVAGPVIQGKVQTTNLPWEFSGEDIGKQTGVSSVSLINDLEATAYGLAALSPGDFDLIHAGSTGNPGNAAIIAPGTGLGEGGLYWDGKSYRPFATEGGHCDFAPRSDTDIEFYQYLRKKYDFVSWERIVSGPGIYNIYQFLRDIKKREEPGWLARELQQEDPAAVISNAALEKKQPLCVETMELFVSYLAHESTNLVLKHKATGGLFIGGGIPPRILPFLKEGIFYHSFIQCDRMEELVSAIPVKVILNDKTALLGAAYYGAFSRPG